MTPLALQSQGCQREQSAGLQAVTDGPSFPATPFTTDGMQGEMECWMWRTHAHPSTAHKHADGPWGPCHALRAPTVFTPACN